VARPPTDARRAQLKKYYEENKERVLARARERYHAVTKTKRALETPEETAARKAKANAASKKSGSWERRRIKRPLSHLLIRARNRATARGREFSITLDDLYIPEICPLLGVPLSLTDPNTAYRPSIDRIDSNKGYIPGNVWVVSNRANRLKSDATADELIRIGLALKGREQDGAH
jgi:hypothetical protein